MTTALTPYEMVKTYTPNLSASQRKANIDYFTMVASITADGGTYVWPDLNKSFTVSGGKFTEQTTPPASTQCDAQMDGIIAKFATKAYEVMEKGDNASDEEVQMTHAGIKQILVNKLLAPGRITMDDIIRVTKSLNFKDGGQVFIMIVANHAGIR